MATWPVDGDDALGRDEHPRLADEVQRHAAVGDRDVDARAEAQSADGEAFERLAVPGRGDVEAGRHGRTAAASGISPKGR
jgi:hypothetical protein